MKGRACRPRNSKNISTVGWICDPMTRERRAFSLRPMDDLRGIEPDSVRRLGNHDLESLWNRSDDLPQMRRSEDGHGIHHRLSRRNPDHRPLEASAYRVEAAGGAHHRSGRLDGDRGAGRLFFMINDFDKDGTSIVF